MEYSSESVHFLHIAYALMILGQLAYVGFVARGWIRINGQRDQVGRIDV